MIATRILNDVDITLRFHSLLLVLVAMHSLPASVCVGDFYFLQCILNISQLGFEANSFEPLIVLFDEILDKMMLLYGLLLADRQLAHELVCELALTLPLAVLAEEVWVGVRGLARFDLLLDLALNVLVEEAF